MSVDATVGFDPLSSSTDFLGIRMRTYTSLTLTADGRRSIKALCKRSNYRGFVSIAVDYIWILAACVLPLSVHPLFYPLSILIIGARQRALASLFHDASHGTLFRSKVLNRGVTRVLCGWPIMQSMSAYRQSHVIAHHMRLGDIVRDPDYRELVEAGIYKTDRGSVFFRRFVLSAFYGRMTFRYLRSLIQSRLYFSFKPCEAQIESWTILIFHLSVSVVALTQGWLVGLVLLWWVPLTVVFPLIGWFSELSEHYPLMDAPGKGCFGARNRYAGRIERLFIGMHADSLHLTHHLLPGVPHWNLGAATRILRADDTFAEWDDRWGGIFSSDRPERITFIDFVRTPGERCS